jgi:hypothetical protein
MPLGSTVGGREAVLKRRVGVQEPHRLRVVGLEIPVRVYRGDERTLVVDHRLAFHEARDDHGLVQGQALVRQAGLDLGRQLRSELGQQPHDDGARRRVLATDLELVGVRRDVALERASGRQIGEEVELVEDVRRRGLQQGGELLDVHDHLARREGRDDLLEPQPLPDGDGGDFAHRLALQRSDDLRGSHRR